ncbi:Inositol 2-dehydrogenase [Thalassoglobus neptunius]|uniref:Inositol 2-dehydrogenase n=1 Tax=Thalassoglobus neptunius TaxID=1938619 RepID=A0A5C5WP27_9PLAN|nr:Gfo/Idh/MocA family oxidoreductase [Thalassoglobus neptunius]TWT52180.1 Inositol 2-dehydrogenase [Thalassoglobus neptunius]
MSQLNRRIFLGAAASGIAATAGLTRTATAQSTNRNNEIGIGVIGMGGRGNELSNGFRSAPGARIVAVADPDEKRSGQAGEKFAAKSYQDLRRLLDDKNVDAVVVATCNHWHCLAAIWAIQAGKDVYVEKPLSHSQWEGEQVVKAARKESRIVQIGTQQRSDPMQAEIKQFLHEDQALGKVLYAQANRLGPRASVGKRETPLPIPEGIDYDLWCGPAQMEDLYRNSFHYDWHWDWNTGSGEMGNWGVHVLDDVRNIAYQDSVTTPQRILACGGRVAWNDAADSPNVHYVYFDTGTFPTLIALSNLNKAPNERGGWPTNTGLPTNGPSSGYVVACEGGYYLGQRGRGKAVDKDGREIRSFKGGDINALHKANFLDAVRSRDRSSLNAEVEVGHHSTGWCNLANVGFRAGEAFDAKQARSIDNSLEQWDLLLKSMESQLGKFDVKLSDMEIRMSPILTHNPETERFEGEHADSANKFLKREYREKYTVPEIS